MTQRFRRFFIVLFALLQCVAPLLHAHAAAGGHGGVHLPEWLAVADGHGHPHLADGGHAHPTLAIGMESSLEARHDGPPVDAPMRLPPPLFADVVLRTTLHAGVHLPPAAGLSRHFLPPPCAPPPA